MMEPFSLAMLLMVVGMVGIEGGESEATRFGRREEREREKGLTVSMRIPARFYIILNISCGSFSMLMLRKHNPPETPLLDDPPGIWKFLPLVHAKR